MPAEKIPGVGMPIDVRVAWGLDSGDIQIATQHAQGAQQIISIVNEWLAAAGATKIVWEEIRHAADAYDPPGIGFDGWHATISDRRDINKLIAVLRKARDQALGRDE